MANYCDFNIRLKAPNKKIAYLIYHTQPTADENTIYYKKEKSDGYYLFYTGCCKWSVDNYCKKIKGLKVDISSIPELDEDSQDEIPQDIFDTLWNVPMEQKSKIFKTNMNVLSWSEETGFADYKIIENGKTREGEFDVEHGVSLIDEFDDYGDEDFDEAMLFNCKESDYIYNESEYDSFEDFLDNNGLPSVLKLDKHFTKTGKGTWSIIQIGENFTDQPNCEWTIE